MTDTEVYDLGVDETQTPSDLRTVSAFALPAVQAKVDKANKKAKRLGLDARLTLVVVERRFVKVNPDGLAEREVVDHRIVGTEIVLPGGWKFLAALDHSVPGTNVVRRAPNLPDVGSHPMWARTAAPACDHCGQDRRRNDTYLVVNAEGLVQQVGSSCLVDFLGLTPAQVGWIFEEISDSGYADDGNGGRQAVVLPTETFLRVVAFLVRTEGWVSRKFAQDFDKVATADQATHVLVPFSKWDKEESKRVYNALTDADAKVATDALAWLTSDEFDVQGDYGWNLRAAFAAPHVTLRNVGIAASLVFCWLRKSEQLAERKAKAAASTSVHEGTVGAKVTLDLIVTGTRTFDGDYGARLLVKAVTPTGSEVVTWTTPHTKIGAWAQEAAGDGKTYAVKGTVKDHGNFNGVAQTTITRASLA